MGPGQPVVYHQGPPVYDDRDDSERLSARDQHALPHPEGFLVTWALKPFVVGIALSLGMSVGYGFFDLLFGRRKK